MANSPACVFVGLIAVSAVLTGCGTSDGGTVGDSATTPPATVTVTRAPTSSKATTVAPKTTLPKRTKATNSSPDDNGTWVMPNEVGRVLQVAQDDVQRASGDPVFVSHSHDLLEDRFQVLDRDWQVCTQNVAPGTRVGPAAHIDFGVVKIDESCP